MSIQPRCLLALLLLALAPPAPAVTLGADGSGQVLLFPYYTVEGGHQTVLSVTNTDVAAKALKVRFREAHNGRNVLEFNLYLGVDDTWTAAIFALPDSELAHLTTPDDACTVPDIRTNAALPQLGGLRYVGFRNFYLADAEGIRERRTREGFVEVIEMGTLAAESPPQLAATARDGRAPTGCAELAAAWQLAGYWSADRHRFIEPPRGGLTGHAALVDVADGVAYAAPPVALDAFRDAPLHGDPVPTASLPDRNAPTLADARSAADGSAVAQVLVGGRLRTSTYPAGRTIDAVSAVLTAEQLFNEHFFEPAIGARTDWVVTLPTRQFYADADVGSGAPIAPFAHRFVGSFPPDAGCERTATSVLDRNAHGPVNTCNFSAPGAYCCGTATTDPGACGLPDTVLCTQVEVLSFSAAGSPLGSTHASVVPALPFRTGGGIARLDLGNQFGERHALRPSLEGHVYRGLPAIGFAARQFVNAHLEGGVLANYADVGAHRARRECVEANGDTCL